MKIAIIVKHPIAQLAKYTTSHLAVEALRRGHSVSFVHSNDLILADDGKVEAAIYPLESYNINTTNDLQNALRSTEITTRLTSLNEYDVILLRYNPTEWSPRADGNSMLEVMEFARRLQRSGVFVLSNPDSLRLCGSKLYLLEFPPHIRPRTFIARAPGPIKDFIRKLKRPAVIKPLNGYGGINTFFIAQDNTVNLNQMIESITNVDYCVVQEFIDEDGVGEKRLLLLDGKPISINNRVAIYTRVRTDNNDIRHNILVGAQPHACSFTSSDARIVDVLRPRLEADGVFLAGIDILGNKVLEINAFCTGGINNINNLYGINVGEYVIVEMEKKVEARRQNHG
ncbi:hypothetical protein ACFL54_01840 [Planctomycetota bacterium]